MLRKFLSLIFPPKCVLCRCLLTGGETDFCQNCQRNAPETGKTNFRFSFLAGWTAVWYYKGDARKSLLRYKFSGRRNYAPAYGRRLAMHLQKEGLTDYDVLTFVPIAPVRRFFRGYDQVELLSNALGKELDMIPIRTLRKIRNTPPQSGIRDASHRRANVLGAYRAYEPENIHNKRILLLDDVITTGATASECARVLLTAGAKEVFCATMAVASHNTKKCR